MDLSKTAKMIEAYSQNRVIFGDFYRENRFKTLLKEYDRKFNLWILATVASGISLLFLRTSWYFKGFFGAFWALGSIFWLSMSDELLVVSNELFDKYEKMIEIELPLTKKISARKVNKEIKIMFGI